MTVFVKEHTKTEYQHAKVEIENWDTISILYKNTFNVSLPTSNKEGMYIGRGGLVK